MPQQADENDIDTSILKSSNMHTRYSNVIIDPYILTTEFTLSTFWTSTRILFPLKIIST